MLAELHKRTSELLASKNHKYLGPRRHIVEALFKADRPLSITQLCEITKLPVSSIYRNLSTLEKVSAIAKVAGIDDSSRFEISTDMVGTHHHHVECVQCGKFSDVFPTDELEKLIETVEKEIKATHAFSSIEHTINFHGVCSQCEKLT